MQSARTQRCQPVAAQSAHRARQRAATAVRTWIGLFQLAGNDAVAAGVLGLIQRRVGDPQQFVHHHFTQ